MKTIETQRGNIIVLILVAVALFAGLTFTLSNSMQGGSSDELSEAQVKLHATQMISYSAQVEAAIDQMIFNGMSIEQINPVFPSHPAFETGSDIHKLFHVDGGGMNYKPPTTPPFEAGGLWGLDYREWDWTPTATQDFAMVAVGVQEDICGEINNQLVGDVTIPTLTSLTDPVTAAECPGCVGNVALCLWDAGNSIWVFYSIVAAQ